MLTINRQDVAKTVLVIWFIAATGYFVWDQYANYRVQVVQQSYQAGYTTAIENLIKKTKESKCQSFEVAKDNDKVNLVSAECLQQLQQPALQSPQAIKK